MLQRSCKIKRLGEWVSWVLRPTNRKDVDVSLANLVLDETGSEVDMAHLVQAIGLANGARSLAVAIYPRLLQFCPSKSMTDRTTDTQSFFCSFNQSVQALLSATACWSLAQPFKQKGPRKMQPPLMLLRSTLFSLLPEALNLFLQPPTQPVCTLQCVSTNATRHATLFHARISLSSRQH